MWFALSYRIISERRDKIEKMSRERVCNNVVTMTIRKISTECLENARIGRHTWSNTRIEDREEGEE